MEFQVPSFWQHPQASGLSLSFEWHADYSIPLRPLGTSKAEAVPPLVQRQASPRSRFWRTVFFGDKGASRNKVVLVENDKIISDDKEVAQTFNDYYDNAVKSLGISENKILTTEIDHSQGKVLDAIKKYESHPSIVKIRENVKFDSEFSFYPVSLQDIRTELKALSSRKASPFMGITAKQLKDVMFIIDKPLQEIWNKKK